MNAQELTDPRDRAAAARAEEKACHGVIDYEKLNEAFQFYVRFKGIDQGHMHDLSYLEQETVLAIAAYARDEESTRDSLDHLRDRPLGHRTSRSEDSVKNIVRPERRVK